MAKARFTVRVDFMMTQAERDMLGWLAGQRGLGVGSLLRLLVREAVYGKSEPAPYITDGAGGGDGQQKLGV